MIQGPITNQHVHDGDFPSDQIIGTNAAISVVIDEKEISAFDLKIISVNHGVLSEKFSARAFGDAGNCHFDIGCSVGNGWSLQSDAVAYMVNGAGGECSGALVNNDCDDMTPLFLTADHCLGGNFNLYSFRFNFEATSPTCPGNSTGEDVHQYETFTGAMLRASNGDTDFALLEFNNPIVGTEGLAVAGWSRSTSAPSSGATIHHPVGDAKKISLFTATADEDDDYTLIAPGEGFIVVESWVVDWTTGVIEGGSSGGPLFDQNKRVVGQLAGGILGCAANNPEGGFGRFHDSWTGGGTNNTRLSNWLSDGTAPTTTNTVRVPYLNTNGLSILCTTNKSVTLVNPVAGRSTSWSVSPSSLFATTSGASTSGSGTSATIRAKNSSSSGNATITYTLSKSGCDPVNVSHNFWVGPPNTLPAPPVFINTSSPLEACIDATSTLTTGPVSSGYVWNFGTWEPYVTGYPEPGNKKVNFNIPYYAPSSATITVRNSNVCGNGPQRIGYFNAIDCYSYFSYSPNPASNSVHISSKADEKSRMQNNPKIFRVEIYDQNSRKRKSSNYKQGMSDVLVDVSSLEPGVYTFMVYDGQSWKAENIIVSK